MKRILTLLLCMALLLAGCSGRRGAASSQAAHSSGAASSAAAQPTAPPQPTAQPTPRPTQAPEAVQPLTGEAPTGVDTRPVAVMVDNSVYAQTQWGLADAQLVMEALTEGKHTNLCLWFGSVDAVPKTGPVAEGKDLFWQFAIAQNAIPVQKGMNTYARNLLDYYRWQPVDALYVGVNSFDYDSTLPYGTADAYRWYTKGGLLHTALGIYGLAGEGVSQPVFRFGKAAGANTGAAQVELLYSEQRSTLLRYDAATGLWGMLRSDGTPQLDANTGTQAAFTNVVLLRCAASVKDDRFTREYDLTGGTGWYLTGDSWQPILWRKGGVSKGLTLYDAGGSELTVNTGRSYIGVYGVAGQRVTVSAADGTALQVDTADGTVAYDLSAGIAVSTAVPTQVPAATPTAAPAAG